MALPLWEERHLSSLSREFWLYVCLLSLTHIPIGSRCGKVFRERSPTRKISLASGSLFGADIDEVGPATDVPGGPLPNGQRI